MTTSQKVWTGACVVIGFGYLVVGIAEDATASLFILSGVFILWLARFMVRLARDYHRTFQTQDKQPGRKTVGENAPPVPERGTS